MGALENRNCIITGASRGLGAKIANAFWEQGANVMVVARSTESLARLVSSFPQRPQQRAIALTADLSDPKAPERIFSAAQNEFEVLDVLVNDAGIQGPIGPAWDCSWDEWHLTLQVDLLSPVALCRLCVPWMARRGRGKIINLSGGARPAASEFRLMLWHRGLVRFSETLAQETLALGIGVNCIAPGAMNTGIQDAVLNAGPQRAGQKEYEQALRIRQSGGAPLEQAAHLCVFLASSASDGITGKLISAVWDPGRFWPNTWTI
jgi:3-oxoacyl-[acyl-carrier protein] reductase